MILVALLLQAASAPPVPPPPRASLDAALLLWADHPPAEQTRRFAIELAVTAAAYDALRAINMDSGGSLSSIGRFLKKVDRLKPLIARRVPADMTQIDRAVGECVVTGIAWAMTPAEIAEVREYMATRAGRKFWATTALGVNTYNECMKYVLRLRASPQDYRAIGLQPPKPPRPGTMVL